MSAVLTNSWMRLGLPGVLLLGLCGCATTNFCTSCCWPAAEVIPHGEVKQIMAFWADGVCVQPDPFRQGLPTPGFSGRVCLYGANLAEPIGADGTLTVHLYDASQPKIAQRVPLEVWNLDEANLARLAKKDMLGWGYNLWLPWTTVKPDIHSVEMVVKYHPRQGIDVWSGTTKLTVNEEGKVRPPSQLALDLSSRGPEILPSRDAHPNVRASTIAVPRGSSLSRVVPESPGPNR